MKKLLVLILSAITIATLFLIGCSQKTAADKAKETNDFYGMGAVTAVKLLNSEFSAQALNGLSGIENLSRKTSSDDLDVATVKQHAEKFNQYLGMLDGFLGDDLVSTALVDNKDEGFLDYAKKLTIIGRDVQGNKIENVMYYNETLGRVEEEKDDMEVEIEKEYRLEGVLVLNGKAYPMSGERSEETEGNEQEDEIKIRAFLNENDRSTYVQVKQETSSERGEFEEEYVYTVVENGRVIEETAVKFENEEKPFGKNEIKYEVEFLTGEGKGEYSIKKIADGDKTKLKVEYELNGKEGEFIITEKVDGLGNKSYEYRFADGSTLTFGGGAENPVDGSATDVPNSPVAA